MSDLFESLTFGSDKSGEVRKSSGELLGALKGKGKSGSTGLSLPRRTGKSDGLPFSLAEGRRANRFGDLREQAIRLANEIEEAEEQVAHTGEIQAPFEQAFWTAHRELEHAWEIIKQGSPVYRSDLLASYDRRMNAGHRWHPSRKAHQTALSWLKAIRTELKAVNAEIGT